MSPDGRNKVTSEFNLKTYCELLNASELSNDFQSVDIRNSKESYHIHRNLFSKQTEGSFEGHHP
jgi:hypothetical protein